MNWAQHHRTSEVLASEATVARRGGDSQLAEQLYARAGAAEEIALSFVSEGKPRTLGITAVSAVSLFFKGAEFERAERLACRLLSSASLPAFAAEEIRLLLQSIWTEKTKAAAKVAFLPGQVFVSVSGGEVVTGGAPLDLIIDKVQTVQALFFRTIELLRRMPHRQRGGPPRFVQESCRPWLFQAPPGSYQFSVAVQEPAQADFFLPDVKPHLIADHFLNILRATAGGDPGALEILVPDQDYRSTFLKLARHLAPTGRSYERLELSSAANKDGTSVVLGPEDRQAINHSLRVEQVTQALTSEEDTQLRGVLRAVHLDKDWLDVQVDGIPVHIEGVRDTIDDLIGPLINKRVLVRALRGAKGKYTFRDIELDE